MLHAGNGHLAMGDARMDYIVFGRGEKHLIMLPGLGDGLLTVRGKALPFALLYRMYAKHFRVWMFSRKLPLPRGHTTRDMAHDLKAAMDLLGIPKAHIYGVSMGGMIAQYMAIDHPERVDKLVLAVTTPKADPMLKGNLAAWMDMARRGDYAALMTDNMEKMYTEGYLRRNRWALPLTTRVGKPRSFDSFLIQAEACMTHDAQGRMGEITAPTLVLGGAQDHTLDPRGSRQLAQAIRGSQLHLWPDYGHAAYDEAKDFDARILDFLK